MPGVTPVPGSFSNKMVIAGVSREERRGNPANRPSGDEEGQCLSSCQNTMELPCGCQFVRPEKTSAAEGAVWASPPADAEAATDAAARIRRIRLDVNRRSAKIISDFSISKGSLVHSFKRSLWPNYLDSPEFPQLSQAVQCTHVNGQPGGVVCLAINVLVSRRRSFEQISCRSCLFADKRQGSSVHSCR